MSRQAAGVKRGGDFTEVYNKIKFKEDDNTEDYSSDITTVEACENVAETNVGDKQDENTNVEEVNDDMDDDLPVISQSKFHESPKKELLKGELKYRQQNTLDTSQFLQHQHIFILK